MLSENQHKRNAKEKKHKTCHSEDINRGIYNNQVKHYRF